MPLISKKKGRQNVLLLLGFMALHSFPIFAQSASERFWLLAKSGS
jgi:hypothetical protein